MKTVEPKVFLIGEPVLIPDATEDFLECIGAGDWTTDAATDVEKLHEMEGRLCYMSFVPGLNPNVTKIREGNEAHLGNLIKKTHGSVFQHGMLNFMFVDVSRTFTHELIRHHVGIAVSQESHRFVLVVDLALWLPEWVKADSVALDICRQHLETLERLHHQLIQHYQPETKPFVDKKKITSFLRRLLPEGRATKIGWSVNPRALRYILHERTQPAAEEEMRRVFTQVGEKVIKRYPALFQDFQVEMVDGLPWYNSPYFKA